MSPYLPCTSIALLANEVIHQPPSINANTKEMLKDVFWEVTLQMLKHKIVKYCMTLYNVLENDDSIITLFFLTYALAISVFNSVKHSISQYMLFPLKEFFFFLQLLNCLILIHTLYD